MTTEHAVTASNIIARWALAEPAEIIPGIELLRVVGSLDTDGVALLISHGEAIAAAKQAGSPAPAKRRGRPRKAEVSA